MFSMPSVLNLCVTIVLSLSPYVQIRIPLPDQHSGNDTDEGCESGSTSEECALDGSKVATKTRRKSKASRSKSAPEKSPPQATTAKESDGTSITPSQSPPVSASFIVPPAIEVVEYNKPVVHSEDCVGFLDLFDKAYGRKAEPAVVKSKSALDFLSQFDAYARATIRGAWGWLASCSAAARTHTRARFD